MLVANLSEFPFSSPTLGGDLRPLNFSTSEDDWLWAAGQSVSVILGDVEQARKSAIAHCLMSGSLCVLSLNVICVMDYFGPGKSQIGLPVPSFKLTGAMTHSK